VSRLKDGAVTSYTTRQGLTTDYGGSLYEAPDGSLWVGTDQGLNRIEHGKITTYASQGELTGSYIHCTAKDEVGMILSVTNLGIRRFKNGSLPPFTPVKVEENAFSIYRQANGTLWLCTPSGLLRLRGEQTTWYTSKDGLASNLVYSIHEDRQGKLWIATGKGLSLWNGERVTTFRQSRVSSSLASTGFSKIPRRTSGSVRSWGSIE
jgi:ligand-binding sensor domain-containing protein